jgi:hypothetical protein
MRRVCSLHSPHHGGLAWPGPGAGVWFHHGPPWASRPGCFDWGSAATANIACRARPQPRSVTSGWAKARRIDLDDHSGRISRISETRASSPAMKS